MTDKYIELRTTLDTAKGFGPNCSIVLNSADIHTLLSDYDRMRDALASIIDIAARPAVIEIARAALAQEQEEA